jgi:hypothetical protein
MAAMRPTTVPSRSARKYSQRKAPITAQILEHLGHFVMVLRANFAAFQDLAAQGIQANQEHATSFLAGAIHMEDIAAALLHLCS